MKTFTLQLQDSTHSEAITGVTSFVGEDVSGSFGILAGHARMITVLLIGLARFRIGDDAWHYLALPGALLYFHNNRLSLSTRHYIRDADYLRISTALQQQLLKEEEKLHAMKESLHHMEEEVLKRLWDMGNRSSGGMI